MTFDNLIAIHAELFSETDLNQQIKKWEEEYNEWSKAEYGSEEELYEAADMVVVSAGIARFDYAIGLDYLKSSLMKADDTSKLWQAVEKKVEKLKKRVWVRDPQVGYKHAKGIED